MRQRQWRYPRISSDGRVETIAGTGGVGSPPDGSIAANVKLGCERVRYDAQGNLYFVNSTRIRRVATNGVLSTIAGNGQMGDLGDGGPALEAQIEPSDFGFDSKGNVYIVSSLHQRVRRVRPDGIIEPYAGISHLDRCSIVSSVCDQGSAVPAPQARFDNPSLLTVDPNGNVYVAESFGTSQSLIRMISPDGIVSPWAGLGSTNDGTGLNTAFARIFALESDSGGSLLVAAEHLGSLPSINRIGTDGKIAKLAGTSAAGAQNADGPALSVRLGTLAGVAAGRDGSVYFGDGRILRRVTTQATIETVAGGMPLAAPDGMAAKGAWFVNPSGLQVNRKGEAFVLDGCSIRKVGTDGILSTLAVLGKCGAPVPNGPPAVAGSSFVGPVVIDSQQRVIVAAAGGLHAIGADGNGILLASSAGMEGAFSVAIDSADRI